MPLADALPVRTGSPGHLRAFDYLGRHRYSLTFCTDQRQPRFLSSDPVDLVLKQLARAAKERKFTVIAYCFMPDHLHLLVEGANDDSECKRFISAFKQYSGFCFSQRHGERLWQRYGFEHVLRDDELSRIVARYILENPIRGGLVKRIEDYPFAGSLEHSMTDLLEWIAYRSG